MQETHSPSRQLTLSLILSLVAVVALTAWLDDASAQTTITLGSLRKHSTPTQTVPIGQRITYTLELTLNGAISQSFWLTDYIPLDTIFITATPSFTPDAPAAGQPLAWLIPGGFYSPAATISRTLVLSVSGEPRVLLNQAAAGHPYLSPALTSTSVWATGDKPLGVCQRDLALLFDASGSMQEGTRCYGCWQPNDEAYPSGDYYPLPFTDQCQPSAPLLHEGYHYLSIEAEHYSRYETNVGYHWGLTESPQIWWALQRDPGKRTTAVDERGAFMKVGPNAAAMNYYTLADVVTDMDSGNPTAPRLEYDFQSPISDTLYVWIRAQGGPVYSGGDWDIGRAYRRRIYVGLGSRGDAVPLTTGNTCYWGPYGPYAGPGAASSSVRKNGNPPSGVCNTNSQGWSWSRVTSLNGLLTDTQHTLAIWAAGAGFSLDKIVITNNPSGALDRNGHPLDWADNGVSDGGPGQTRGRTDWACMPEDARFTPITNGLLDDLYDDQQPLRWAKQANKGLVDRLNPLWDQAAFVRYGSSSSIRHELFCQLVPGFCENFAPVAAQIEAAPAEGSTNIAGALWDGLRALSVGPEPDYDPDGLGFPPRSPGAPHYGRPGVYKALILFTDGKTNISPDLPSGYGDCYSDELWPYSPGETKAESLAKECVVWFALHARQQGVALHTISLGPDGDHDLLAYIADLTGGSYHYIATADGLDEVLASIEHDTRTACLSFSRQVVYLPIIIKND